MKTTDSVPNQADTVVVGAGIVGCNLAYQLTRMGREDVVVVDQGPMPTTGAVRRDVHRAHLQGTVHQGVRAGRSLPPVAVLDAVAVYLRRERAEQRAGRRGRTVPVHRTELRLLRDARDVHHAEPVPAGRRLRTAGDAARRHVLRDVVRLRVAGHRPPDLGRQTRRAEDPAHLLGAHRGSRRLAAAHRRRAHGAADGGHHDRVTVRVHPVSDVLHRLSGAQKRVPDPRVGGVRGDDSRPHRPRGRRRGHHRRRDGDGHHGPGRLPGQRRLTLRGGRFPFRTPTASDRRVRPSSRLAPSGRCVRRGTSDGPPRRARRPRSGSRRRARRPSGAPATRRC
ncbi:FAD-dependent oxidoreductase [Halorubrum trueperi]|uniref:FAD-dependent oxidoreductase n=1 Tax=Halorubrum trueperi TaxID=2004704 RepID=A0ABD5ULG8_9EURY